MITFEEYFVQLQGFLSTINARSGRASVGYFERIDFSEYAEDLESIHLKILEGLIEKNKFLKSKLIEPTKIYVQEILSLINNKLINGCANITGGGLVDNVKRIIPDGLGAKIDLNKIISRSLNLHELSEPGISFVFSKVKFLSYIKGDEEQLNRVFLNLIKNSIESIYDKRSRTVDFKGKINIDIRDDRDYIYVTIVDNGVGFNRVDKTKMLTPYFTTKKNGTGLGLAIVTKVISDHNSLIAFNSITNGAKIEITIPRYYD